MDKHGNMFKHSNMVKHGAMFNYGNGVMEWEAQSLHVCACASLEIEFRNLTKKGRYHGLFTLQCQDFQNSIQTSDVSKTATFFLVVNVLLLGQRIVWTNKLSLIFSVHLALQ